MVGVGAPDVDAPFAGGVPDSLGPAGNMGQHRVEEPVVHDLNTGAAQSGRHRAGVIVDPAGDRRQAVGAVVAGVHGGHHGQQHLGGADVRSRLIPADVLFAGLQREPVGP